MQVCFLVFIPHSPRFLYTKKRDAEAEASLRILRRVKDVSIEAQMIHDAVHETALKQVSFKDTMKLLLTRTMLKHLVISVGMVVFMQLSGTQ